MRIPIRKKRTQSHSNILSLTGLAFAIALTGFSLAAHAGKIVSVPSASGAPGFGGWNLGNIEVILNGTQGPIGDPNSSWFNPADGAYNFDDGGTVITSAGPVTTIPETSYQANVYDGIITQMGIVLAKDWPIGEPAGIKIVHDDFAVKTGRPTNCIMSTSYLDDHFLDAASPEQVLCSGPWQSHKRYKLAMLPTTCDSNCSEGVDLAFNVEAETGSRDYQVFQKINNWTGSRLQGFTIEVGFGIGTSFQTVADAGIALADLNISVPDTAWDAKQLAVFSVGLFGVDSHTGGLGFFDPADRAGFYIDEYGAGPQPLTSILHATTTLGSDYAEVPPGAATENQFGPWLSNNMLPFGIFEDDDGNPNTDNLLVAWYGYNPALPGFGWMGGSQDSDGPFSAVPAAEINSMGSNLLYTMGVIDDLVNVGLNYVVTVGDVSKFPGSTFTIRITPTPDTSATPAPGYVGLVPDPIVVYTSSTATVLLSPTTEFVIGSLLTARVGDADRNTDPLAAEKVHVTISTSTGLSESLILVEQGANRGVFAGSLPSEFSNVPAGTVVTMAYADATGVVPSDAAGSAGSTLVTTSTTAIVAPPPVAAPPVVPPVFTDTAPLPTTPKVGPRTTPKVPVDNVPDDTGSGFKNDRMNSTK